MQGADLTVNETEEDMAESVDDVCEDTTSPQDIQIDAVELLEKQTNDPSII